MAVQLAVSSLRPLQKTSKLCLIFLKNHWFPQTDARKGPKGRVRLVSYGYTNHSCALLRKPKLSGQPEVLSVCPNPWFGRWLDGVGRV